MAELVDNAAIRSLSALELVHRRDELIELLADAVDGGASVGYRLPHVIADYVRFWNEVAASVGADERVVLACELGTRLVGVVQFVPCLKPNGRHRGEIQKLLVLRAMRGRGIGSRLMCDVEALAVRRGHRLLLLDTRADSPAEQLYRRLGWRPFGAVPGYASDPDGTLATCVFFYRQYSGDER